MNESKPRRQSKRMMGNTHAGRVRLKLSVSRPAGSLSMVSRRKIGLAETAPAVKTLAPRMVIGHSGECSSHEPRPMRVEKFTL